MSLEKLRKKYPEYNDLPDLELAERFYKKHYSDMDETEYYKKMFPQIAAERAEDAPHITELDLAYGMQIDPSSIDFRPKTSEIAKQAGVSINDPASSNARFAASLGYNEEQKILAIKQTLSDSFKEDIDVRVGPSTGELEYYNPKIGKYALVDEPGMDIGDLADLGGDAMVILPDIGATIGVSFLVGPWGGITAGAAAAMGGEWVRLKLGQKIYGINKDMTDEQLWKSMKTTGQISLGAGVLGIGAINMIKGINNLIKGRTIPDDVVGVLDDVMVKETDLVAKTINDTLDTAKINSKLKYTLAEALDDPDMLASQAAFENVKKTRLCK